MERDRARPANPMPLRDLAAGGEDADDAVLRRGRFISGLPDEDEEEDVSEKSP